MPRFNGQQLKILRISRRWTYADLAGELATVGLKATPGRVSAWETGRENVAPSALSALAEIFEVEIEVLLRRKQG